MIRKGYIRVSSEDQNPQLQYDALHAAGLKAGEIYCDVESGTVTSRTAYTRLTEAIRNDIVKEVVVYRLERLGRDPVELIRFFELLEKHNVTFRSLTEPWLTRWNYGPMEFFTWWLQIGMARFELLLLKDRQRRGIQAKKESIARGTDEWRGRGPDKKPRKSGPG